MDAINKTAAKSVASLFISRRDPREAGGAEVDEAGTAVEPAGVSFAAEGEVS